MPVTEGDIEALYVKYGYFIFRRCLAFMSDEASAQDAVQEVFVRALQNASAFRDQANPKTWLCRISDHHCIDLLRRQRTRGESSRVGSHHLHGLDGGEGHRAREGDVHGHASGDGNGHPISSPLVHHDDPESLLTARRLMDSLDPEARRLAVLYFVDELTQDEMAAELGLSRRTIGKHLKELAIRAKALLGERKLAI